MLYVAWVTAIKPKTVYKKTVRKRQSPGNGNVPILEDNDVNHSRPVIWNERCEKEKKLRGCTSSVQTFVLETLRTTLRQNLISCDDYNTNQPSAKAILPDESLEMRNWMGI